MHPNVRITNFRTALAEITPTLDTNAYAAGDVLFVPTEIDLSTGNGLVRGTIRTVALLDKDDQAAQTVTLYFFRENVTLGTINAAISISDDDAAKLIGTATVTTSTDLVNSRFGQNTDIGLPFSADTGSVWVAASTGGTPTHTASGMHLRFSFELETEK